MGKDKEKGEPPMERIEERISGAKLTARDRKVLDYMMKNKETACFMAAAEIAELLEVSASCVVRLSGKLGFPTYYQFKRALQEEVAKSRLEEKGCLLYTSPAFFPFVMSPFCGGREDPSNVF